MNAYTEVAAGMEPDGDRDNQLQLDFTASAPDGAYDGVELADQNTEAHWRDEAMAQIEFLARTGVDFTADEVRKVVGEPDHPNRWGAVFLAARKRGLIEPTGTIVPSTTASRHGAIVRVWRGVA